MKSGLGPTAEIRPEPWSTRERWFFALFAIALLGSLCALVHPWYDARRDAAVYIATARSLLAGEGYSFLGEPFRIRPPGFSLLISPVVWAFGNQFSALNGLISLFGVAGALLLYLFERARIGWILAMLSALAIWLNPGYQRFCNQVMSDVPGAALLIGCLLVERWSSRSPSWQRELALGLCIGLAFYVRSATFLILPAIIAARTVQRTLDAKDSQPWLVFCRQRIVPVFLISTLLLIPWIIRNQRVDTPERWEQIGIHSYATAFFRKDPQDSTSPLVSPAEVLSRVQQRPLQMLDALGARLLPHTKKMQRLVDQGLNFGNLAFGALVYSSLLIVFFRRRAPADFYVLGLSAVIGLYFGFVERLMLPVFMLGIPACVEVLRDGLKKIAGPQTATGVTAAAIAGLLVFDFAPRNEWDKIEEDHRLMVEAAAFLQSTVAPDAHLASSLAHSYIVHMDRPVFSLSRNRHDATARNVEAIIKRQDIDTVVLRSDKILDQKMLPYFHKRYKLIASAGEFRVFETRQ